MSGSQATYRTFNIPESRAAIRTAFSIGRIEKVAARAAESAQSSAAPSRLGNSQNFHLPNRNSELYFCPLIAVPKIYTAMGVCVHVRLWGNSTAALEDTKRFAPGRVFMIRRTSTTLAEWALLPAFAGEQSHHIIEQGIQVLVNLTHRGACGCDPETGDGAGVLIQIPHKFFARECVTLGLNCPRPASTRSA